MLLLILLVLLVLAIGVPIWALVYWLLQGTSSTLPSASLLSAAGATAGYSAAAAALSTIAALPVALLVERHRSKASVVIVTFQPSFSGPTIFSFGICTLSKKTSLK